jgi:hypothetical protein
MKRRIKLFEEFSPLADDPVIRIDTREEIEKEEITGNPCECWEKLGLSSADPRYRDHVELIEWSEGELGDCLDELGIYSGDPGLLEKLKEWELKCQGGTKQKESSFDGTPSIGSDIEDGGRNRTPSIPQPPVRPGVRKPFTPVVPDQDERDEPLF